MHPTHKPTAGRRRRVATSSVAVLALAFGVVACGDDGDDLGTGTTTSTSPTVGQDAGEGAGTTTPDDGLAVEGFCNAFIRLSSSLMGEPDPATLEPLLQELESAAPEEVREQAAVQANAFRQALAGDEAALEAPEFGQASAAVSRYAFDQCSADDKVEVTGVDYAFQGVPDTVEAGTVAFSFTNEGREPHEMIILGLPDDAEETLPYLQRISELPEDEAQAEVMIAGATFAPPGASSATFIDLEAGDYVMACFIPVGGGEEGRPHFSEGMFAEFTVE